MFKRLSRQLTIVLAIPALAFSAPAWSQAHEQRAGDYTLRSSTVSTSSLSASTARQHGIERAPTRGLVNVTVSKGEQTVPADVSVQARNLTGKTRAIPMRLTEANGYVSYTGTYDFVHGEVLDFIVRAQPQGSKEALSLVFRDRMWGKGDLPDAPSRH